MTDEEAAAMFRADAIAAGLPPHMTPNDIGKALWTWFESAPENPDDSLWLEVRDLLEGYDSTEDYYERCAEACRGVLCRQAVARRIHD
jgi:hypothetical protein